MPNTGIDFAGGLQRALTLLKGLPAQAGPESTMEAIEDFIEEMERPIVTIKTDGDPSNPRDDENAGVMFCQHRRYTLGDADAEDPCDAIEGVEVDGRWMPVDEINYAMDMLCSNYETLESRVEEMREDPEHAEGVIDFGRWTLDGINEVIKELRLLCDHSETRRILRDDIAIAIPLSLYDHSGITIYHGSPQQAWDSGMVGVHYMTRDVLDREFGGDEAKARACMEAELRTYDQYLRGNVWGFEVTDRAGRVIDSCWGFIGANLEETGILDHAEATLVTAFHEAWEQRLA